MQAHRPAQAATAIVGRASMAPVKIEAVELRRLELPLVEPFVTASGSLARRPVLLVRVRTDLGDGVGECPALPEPTYTDEYADGAEAVLATHLLPRLLAAGGPTSPNRTAPAPAAAGDGPPEERALEQLLASLDPVRGHPMAKSAVEMALLDALLRSEGRSLAAWLGASRPRVPAGATVGLCQDVVLTLDAAAEAMQAGYRRLKLKIAPGRDLEPVRAVREAFPELALVADANGSYRLDDPEHLAALRSLDELTLVAIEQPLHPDDLAGHALLAQELETVLLLDESIASPVLLEAALALGFRGAVSIKASRLGGLRHARAVLEQCGREGLGASIGGMLESGIGRRAALGLAALDGFDLPGELCPTGRYLSEDLAEPLVLEDGELVVPEGPGLGAQPGLDALDRTTERKRTWRAA
jgi:O-succinylbenzoate synthase